MDDAATATAPAPQLSPDRQWWWNGHKWEPAGHTQSRPAPAGPPGSAAFHASISGEQPRSNRPVATRSAGWTGPGWNVQPMPPAPPATGDGLAIASLVVALVALFGCVVAVALRQYLIALVLWGSIPAVVLGHRARGRAQRARQEPSGVALAGLILGYVGIGLLVVGILAAIAIPTFLNQRAKRVLARNLTAAAGQENAYHRATGTYATIDTLRAQGLRVDLDVQMAVLATSPSSYCLGAQLGSMTRYYSPQSGVQPVSCVGAVAGNAVTG